QLEQGKLIQGHRVHLLREDFGRSRKDSHDGPSTHGSRATYTTRGGATPQAFTVASPRARQALTAHQRVTAHVSPALSTLPVTEGFLRDASLPWRGSPLPAGRGGRRWRVTRRRGPL